MGKRSEQKVSFRPRTWTIAEILSESDTLKNYALYKAIKRRTISRRNAVELERITEIPRERWVWPGHYEKQDPWDLILVGANGESSH